MKNRKINIGFFISDDGYGHAVRQSSIIDELLKVDKNKNLHIHVYANKILNNIKKKFAKKIKYQKFDNIIQTKKNLDGSLSKVGTKKIFKIWKKNKKKLINKVKLKIQNYDLVITDSVPHVFDAAKELNITSLNISHYTWDWFYLKTFKKDKLYKELLKSYSKVDKLIFPPLTEPEILKTYKNKIHKINYIITDSFAEGHFLSSKKNKNLQCMIMDNGSKVLSTKISKILKYIKDFKNLDFIICANFFKKKQILDLSKLKHCKVEKDLKKIHMHIPYCDFLIARGGFNTITESLILKKPTLLYNETKNKEVRGNIKHLKKKGLSYPIYKNFFTNKFKKNIDFFVSKKLKKINKNFLRYNFKCNGSKQASKIIISCLS